MLRRGVIEGTGAGNVAGRLVPSIERALAADVPVVELSLLRAVALTAALPGPELERLARALDPVEVESGHAVFHKGDYGDSFYVISHGEFDVLDGERVLNLLARGDAFGEIALLHDVPRTASVIAREPSTIYGLERADFLAAIAGNPGFGRDAEALAQLRSGPDAKLAPAD
jgi:CRP-like cAMP-binding protein